MFAKHFTITAVLLILLASCAPAAPASTAAPSAIPETATATVTPKPRATRTALPTSTLVPLTMQKIEKLHDNCSEKDMDLPDERLSPVAYFPSGFCFHGELDMF